MENSERKTRKRKKRISKEAGSEHSSWSRLVSSRSGVLSGSVDEMDSAGHARNARFAFSWSCW